MAEAILQSIDVAEDADETGLTRRVLRLVSVLAPEGIEVALLSRLLPDADSDAIEQVLAELVGTSLLGWTESGTGVTVHRLVARAVRDTAEAKGELAELVAVSAAEMLAGLPDIEAVRGDRDAPLVGHAGHLWDVAVTAARRDRGLTATVEKVYPVADWARRVLSAIPDLHRAVALGIQIVGGCERVLGLDHPQTLTSRHNLAGAYQSAGDLGRAVPLYQAVLADSERVLGPDHPTAKVVRENLERARGSGP